MPKLTELDSAPSVASTDAIPVVVDPGGTPATKTATVAVIRAALMPIVNVDVDAAAAIAGTKIAPDFGAQDVVTSGAMGAGYIVLAGGALGSGSNIRLGGATAGVLISWVPDGATDRGWLSSDGASGWTIGTNGNGYGHVRGYTVSVDGFTQTDLANNGAVALRTTGATIEAWKPIIGGGSSPYGVHGRAPITVGASNITLTGSQYASALQHYTGAPAATRTITYPLPATDDGCYWKLVWVNTTTAGVLITNGGGATVAIGAGTSVLHLLWFSQTGVVQLT